MSNRPKLRVYKLTDDAMMPTYAHDDDSGMDVYNAGEDYTLESFEMHKFPTGIAVEIPEGQELQVRPKSGMIDRYLVPMFGTADEGYRGELKVAVFNFSTSRQTIKKGEKVGQIVGNEVIRYEPVLMDNTQRLVNGFGSTGV